MVSFILLKRKMMMMKLFEKARLQKEIGTFLLPKRFLLGMQAVTKLVSGKSG